MTFRMFITSFSCKSSDTYAQINNLPMNWTVDPFSAGFFKDFFFIKAALQSDFTHQNSPSEANGTIYMH